MNLLEKILCFWMLTTPWVSALVYHDIELDSIVIQDAFESGAGDELEWTNKTFGIPAKKLRRESEPADNSSSLFSRYGIQQNCGANEFRDVVKIVCGREAGIAEFPYTVAFSTGRQFCGGSLISNQWVLTAAHCLTSIQNPSSVRIHLGDHDFRNPNEVQHQIRGAQKVFYHRYFNRNTLVHDIGLIKLDRPVQFTQNIRPVCLSNKEPPFTQNSVVSGWGRTQAGGNVPISNKLRTASLNILRNDDCRRKYASQRMPSVTDNMVCTWDRCADACQGDSGGPLVVFNGRAVQVGIVSWGKSCAVYPGVYTKVNRYLGWIDKHLKQ